MKTASSHPVAVSLASVAGGALVFFLFLAFRRIWPLGGNTLEFVDNGQMIYPFLKYLAAAIFSGVGDGSFFYDINAGAGIRVSPSLPHQLLVPSTWVAVVMGDSFMLEDLVWVMAVDVACICLAVSWFLRGVFPSLPFFWNVLLTVCYAMGGFFQTKYGFMQFLDHAFFFPLFALGLYRLVNGGRGWLFAVGLFLLATSLYSAFMAVVIGWLFAWAYTLPLKGTRERRDRLARVFWYTAAVTLATCYYWLPMMDMSRDSLRSLFVTSPTFFELLWPFDPPMFLERIDSILPGMVLAAMVAVCLAVRRRTPFPVNGLRLFLLLLGACLLAVFLEPVHRAAHLWSYVCFPVRFGFIPCLVVVAFCAWLLKSGGLPAARPYRMAGTVWWWLALAGVFVCSLVVFYWSSCSFGAQRLLLLPFFPLAWMAWRHFQGRRLAWSIALLTLLELSVGAAVFWKPGTEELAAIQCRNAEFLAQRMPQNIGLLRVKDADRMMVENSSCLGHIPTISNYRHTTGIRHFRFLKELGYRDEFTRTYGQGGTMFSDQVLGHGFVLKSRRENGLNPVWEQNGMYLYALPDAVWCQVVPQSALGLELNADVSIFDNLNALHAALYPEEPGPLYVPVAVQTVRVGNAYELVIPPHSGALYGFPLTDTDDLRVNGVLVPIMAEAQKKTASLERTYNGVLQLKRNGIDGETHVTGVMKPPVDVPMQVAAVRGRECPAPRIPPGWKDRTLEVRGHGGHVEVRLSAAGNEALMLPLVHERGWRAERNGIPVDIEKVGELMAVRLLPGENAVELGYFPPLLRQSLIFSALAAACFLLYAWWAGHHPGSVVRNMVLACGFRLFMASCFIVLAVVYIGSIVLFVAEAMA